MGHLAVLKDIVLFFFPSLNLIYASAGILIQWDIQLINQFGVLGFDEKRIVFRIVLTGLGAVVAQPPDVFKADHVIVLFRCVFLRGALSNFRIQIVSILITDLQQPAHVVDPRNQLAAALQFIFHSQRFQQGGGTDLYAVA